eukprot:Plantae.Rhodophyta-Purpureofilum_apyrenoidigerum.ctg1903.p1 GENE.Plantae.Rhodophyta-Purpureofilum_apyrenoidigerum.ctg1903~~Plantae.Rhodophyta-Purpureofilum_apyrenoidigerum.ctg1903.p1  ORF type:complete len:198 (+),score=39.97 Plantae.Rhodophyta-Purpureofilum_apyrenoidigerum.ctg1903:239-832(+)
MLSGDYGQSVDLWALGVFLYHVLCGATPFESDDPEMVLEKITYVPIEVPSFVSPQAANLIMGLMNRNPKRRLGAANGVRSLQSHSFFNGIDFKKVMDYKVKGIFAYENENTDGRRGSLGMRQRRDENQLPTAKKKGKGGKGQAHHSIAGFSYSYKAAEYDTGKVALKEKSKETKRTDLKSKSGILPTNLFADIFRRR